MKKIIFTFFLFLSYSTISSQITTKIDYIFLNNQTSISDCNTIDVGSNQNNNLTFYYKLTRPSNLPSGTGKIRVMLLNNSNSTPQEISHQDIFDSSWTNSTYNYTIPCGISASQIQVTGSTIYLEFETTSNIKTMSCVYPIIKAQQPTFTLSPTTLSIACGDMGSKTFTVNNVYNTPSVSYSWSYNGWTPVSSTATSITLVPSSATALPSNVVVTPSVSGVSQPSKTCVVSRAAFSANSEILGNSIICPGSTQTYTLTNSGSYSSVAWNIPQTSVATITSSTNSSVTVQIVGSGYFKLNAVVSNGCGQTATIPRAFYIGVPVVNTYANSNKIFGVADVYSTNYVSPTYASVYNVVNATSFVWTITGSTLNYNCTNTPKFSNGSSSITTYSGEATINWGSCAGNFVLSCKPQNACGLSYAMELKGVAVTSSSGGSGSSPCDNNPIGLKMRNPIKENAEIVLSIHHSQLPCDITSNSKTTKPLTKEQINTINYTVEIYDFFGRRITTKQFKTSEIIIDNVNLASGKYIVNISNDLGYNKREILLVE